MAMVISADFRAFPLHSVRLLRKNGTQSSVVEVVCKWRILAVSSSVSAWHGMNKNSDNTHKIEAEATQTMRLQSLSLAYRAKMVDELCAKVQNEDFKINLSALVSLYDFQLDKFQRLAIKAYLKGSSVVVSAPTSSGKTLIAEAAAAATLAKGRKLLYTTPLKALSNQKFREFRAVFGEANVGLLTGDACINRDAPIVIMTAEILRNKFYKSTSIYEDGHLTDVDVVILDEIHYLGDISRGTVWEETVIYCPKHIQLICLSATVANPEELADWIAKVHGRTDLIISAKRPVPLTWHFSQHKCMLPLLNGSNLNRKLLVIESEQIEKSFIARGVMERPRWKMMEPQRKPKLNWKVSDEEMEFLRRKQVPRISETLKQMKEENMLPAIWFIFSRRRCDEAAKKLNSAGLLTEAEAQQVEEAVKLFREQHPEAIRESSVKGLYQGVAAHHAGCLPVWKSLIEELFQRGLIKVVFATETLAAGINMPARSTVISSFTRVGGKMQLSVSSLLQMAGRAGRRGIDTEGYVVVVQTPFHGPKDCYQSLIAGADPLTSQFTATYGMVLNLLSGVSARIAETETSIDGKRGRSLEEARALIEQSFGNYMGSEVLAGFKAKVADLEAEIKTVEEGKVPDSLSRLYDAKCEDYAMLVEKLKVKERKEKNFRTKYEKLKQTAVQSQMSEVLNNKLPYLRLAYVDVDTGTEQGIPVVYVEQMLENPFSEKVESNVESPYYLALGLNNWWYCFPAKAVTRVGSGLPLDCTEQLKKGLDLDPTAWKQVGSNVWSMSSSNAALFWGVEMESPSEITYDCKDSEELLAAQEMMQSQQRGLRKVRAKLEELNPDELNKLSEKVKKMRRDKIGRLRSKVNRIEARLQRMQPAGWKEFLRVMEVLKACGAMQKETHELLPLGELARSLRGANELWLALALQSEVLQTLKPPQLAAIASCLVGEAIKAPRPESSSSEMYAPSDVVMKWVEGIEPKRQWLLEIQDEYEVKFVCALDAQMAGFVEAWSAGVTWKELDITQPMDEGDFAKLLRRTMDLLAQIPYLPHIDQVLASVAKDAAKLMDRPPISELVK